MAALNSYIHRLTMFPLTPDAYNKEVSIVKQLATDNKLSVDVDDSIRRKTIKVALQRVTTLNPPYEQKGRELSVFLISPLSPLRL